MVSIQYPQKSNFGVLTATEVRTPTVNNPAGNLSLEQAGNLRITVGSGSIPIEGNILLGTGRSIRDGSGNILLDPDDAGAIAALARLDGPVTLASEHQELSLAPVDIVRDLSVGTPDYDRGSIEYAATVNVDIGLTDLFPYLTLGARIKIEDILINGWTTNINTYLSKTSLNYHTQTGAADSEQWADLTDYGNGSINAFTATYAPDETLLVDRLYRLVLELVNGGGTLSIWSIEIKFTLVAPP